MEFRIDNGSLSKSCYSTLMIEKKSSIKLLTINKYVTGRLGSTDISCLGVGTSTSIFDVNIPPL